MPENQHHIDNQFHIELRNLLNRFSKENDSNTPDFILAEYLRGCLDSYNKAVIGRDMWFGVNHNPDHLCGEKWLNGDYNKK